MASEKGWGWFSCMIGLTKGGGTDRNLLLLANAVPLVCLSMHSLVAAGGGHFRAGTSKLSNCHAPFWRGQSSWRSASVGTSQIISSICFSCRSKQGDDLPAGQQLVRGWSGRPISGSVLVTPTYHLQKLYMVMADTKWFYAVNLILSLNVIAKF